MKGRKGTAREKDLEKEEGKLRELQPPAMDNNQLEYVGGVWER